MLKPAYYRNHCIDSNQGLHNAEDCQVLIAGDPNTPPTNPRSRTAAILEKVRLPFSAIVCPLLMKFGAVMHTELLTPYSRKCSVHHVLPTVGNGNSFWYNFGLSVKIVNK